MNHFQTQTTNILSSERTRQTFERTRHLFSNWDLLHEMSLKKTNVNQDISQGWMLEILETAKFNRVATRNKSDLVAQTTDSLGGAFTQHAADIWVKDGSGAVVREAQVKSMKGASKTAYALKDEKYKGMQRIGAKEHNPKVKELVKQRSSIDGMVFQEQYQDVQENLAMNGLSHGGIESGGVTRQEAIEATNSSEALKRARIEKSRDFGFDVHNTGISAAKTGAVIGGGFSTLSNAKKFVKGDTEGMEVVFNIAKDTTQSYITSYMGGAGTRVIEHGLYKFLGESTAKSIVKSSAPSAMAASIISCSNSIYRYINGDIGQEKLADEISGTAIIGATSFYYGAFGQLVIPIPVVGTLIGSTVGYFIGNMLHQSGVVSLGKTQEVKDAIERRKRIEEFCLYAIPLMQEQREYLEGIFSTYFEERSFQFESIFERMDNSLFEDVDEFYSALNDLNLMYGKQLPYKTQVEFDEFMLNDDLSFDL